MNRKKGTHIIAGGFEYDRIVKPMLEYPGDRIIVLRDNGGKYPLSSSLAEHFLKKLKDFPVEIEEISIDIYNFDEVFLKMLELIKREIKERRVYVNISSAPKVTLVAMISSVFFMRGKGDIEIIYCKPEEYLIPRIIETLDRKMKSEFMDHGGGRGVKEYESIPIFPIEEITEIDMKILKILDEKNGAESIKELVEYINRDESRVQRSSIQYRLERLEEKGLISKEREEKRVRLFITRMGEIYLKGGSQ